MVVTARLRRIRAALELMRNGGLEDLAHHGVERIRAALGVPSSAWTAYHRRKAALDAAFDASRGYETGGVQHLCNLTVASPNVVHGVNHVASDPEEFANAMADIEIEIAGSTFVDLGAGKGRAVLLAAEYPFARLVGVEFAMELHAAAKTNVARYADIGDASRIELIHGDAALYEFPSTAVVIYLFNPFGAPIVARVGARDVFAMQ